MLNRRELQEVAEVETMEAPTVSHPALSQLTESEAFTEIPEGRIQLEKAVGRGVWAPAPPELTIPGSLSPDSAEFRHRIATISQQSAVYFGGTILTAAAGYFFKIYLARRLGDDLWRHTDESDAGCRSVAAVAG